MFCVAGASTHRTRAMRRPDPNAAPVPAGAAQDPSAQPSARWCCSAVAARGGASRLPPRPSDGRHCGSRGPRGKTLPSRRGPCASQTGAVEGVARFGHTSSPLRVRLVTGAKASRGAGHPSRWTRCGQGTPGGTTTSGAAEVPWKYAFYKARSAAAAGQSAPERAVPGGRSSGRWSARWSRSRRRSGWLLACGPGVRRFGPRGRADRCCGGASSVTLESQLEGHVSQCSFWLVCSRRSGSPDCIWA